jgi:DHA2 family methylenomycin A resistance protein-like MFS transporter
LFIFALYFQDIAGDSALQGGLSFVPLCGAFAVTGPLIGRLVHRVGHRTPMVVGLALIALGALLLLRVSAHSSYAQIWPAFLSIGVGYGLTSTPMAAAVLGAVPAARAGMASATNNTARQIGGVFGIAILGSLLPATTQTHAYAEHFTTGLHHALIAIAISALVATILTATKIPGRSG